MDSLNWLLPELTNAQWLVHGLFFLFNISLFLFAKPIVRLVDGDVDSDTKVRIFRALNILVLILHALDLVFIKINPAYENFFVHVGMSFMTLYGSIFIYSLCGLFSRRRFGKSKVVDDKTVYFDSYSSRLVDIIVLFVIILATIYTLIKVWGADSMLETTGVFGIIFAFLAFTSNIWAPDIISGLIILNTELLEDGDVVVIDGHTDEYIITKVTLIYVILYDIRNNHRTLIRNNQFIKSKIDNISRIASTDGVRQALTYNLGYPNFDGATKEEREKQLTEYKLKVDKLFELANDNCRDKPDIKINNKRDFEWALTCAGDYALEYTLWVYLERIPNTKVTSTIRKHLMGTMYRVNEAVYSASIIEDIDLSTPVLAKLDFDSARAPIKSNNPLTL